MPNKEDTKVTILGIILNLILFIMKIFAAAISNSLALLSDAFKSLSDILASIGIFIAVRMSKKKADKCHPFGHHRFQPLAGFIVAMLTGILGFEILKTGILSLFKKEIIFISFWIILVPILNIIIKAIMATYFLKTSKKFNSPAIRASGIDSRNDVFVTLSVLIAMTASYYKIQYVDCIVAIGIGLFILYSAYKLAVENANYLIGTCPPQKVIDIIKELALNVKGVKGLNDIRAHYVGNIIHIEIHIEVSKNLHTNLSHDIGKSVQRTVEGLPSIDKAFIHIDPV